MDKGQLDLPFVYDADLLRDFFCRETGREIRLTVTDNSSSMLSVKKTLSAFHVRIHRIFLSAGTDVIREISGFIKTREKKIPLTRDYIRKSSGLLRKRAPMRVALRSAGTYHDLDKLYRSINSEYFGGRVTARVTWGVRAARRAVRRRTLGSYSCHSDTIRINPLLDNKKVPDYYVAFILYHEMLHADIGIETRGRRRSLHSREFRRREKIFSDYERAMALEKTGLL